MLQTIIDHKVQELETRRRARPLTALRDAPLFAAARRDFAAALRAPRRRIIAEVKRASPSRGRIREDFDPVAIAAGYAAAGAAAVSVLTDERFFEGSLDDLTAVRERITIPVLRKDFLFEPYHLYEARAAGADAFLLIAAILTAEHLRELVALGAELGMTALVEVHTVEQIERARGAGRGGRRSPRLQLLRVESPLRRDRGGRDARPHAAAPRARRRNLRRPRGGRRPPCDRCRRAPATISRRRDRGVLRQLRGAGDEGAARPPARRPRGRGPRLPRRLVAPRRYCRRTPAWRQRSCARGGADRRRARAPAFSRRRPHARERRGRRAHAAAARRRRVQRRRRPAGTEEPRAPARIREPCQGCLTRADTSARTAAAS